MKKILLLLCFSLIYGTDSLLAQKKTTTTATPQPEKQTQKNRHLTFTRPTTT